MRRIVDHRFDEGGFNDTIQGLVRNSPWWLTSAVIHGIVGFILAQIPFSINRNEAASTMIADNQKKMDEIEEEEEPEIEPRNRLC